MSCKVTPEIVDEIHTRWRGTRSGRCSLYYFVKKFGLHVNDVYSILGTPHKDALYKAKRGHAFASLKK